MLTGDLRSKIDQIWNAFWSGCIANPVEVIEQFAYLPFLRRLDDLHTLEENKANRLKKPMKRRIFPEAADPRGRAFDSVHWSRFKSDSPSEMFLILGEHVFATRIQAIEAIKATRRAALAQLDALFASLQQRASAEELKIEIRTVFCVCSAKIGLKV